MNCHEAKDFVASWDYTLKNTNRRLLRLKDMEIICIKTVYRHALADKSPENRINTLFFYF